MSNTNNGAAWILSCEAMKADDEAQERYELQVAVLLDSHQKLDEQINSLLKERGYLFLYSGEAKPIIQHLEEADFYDQAAIDLSQQVSAEQPIAFKEIRLIVNESKHVSEEYLTFTQIDTPALPVQDDVVYWEKPWLNDDLKTLLFSQPDNLPDNISLNTYLILDAGLYVNIKGVFDLDLIDSVSIQCLYKGETAKQLEKIAPYIVDMTLPNKQYDSLREEVIDTPKFHRDYFEKHWGKNSGIFIRSTANMEDVSKHFRKFTKVEHPEGRRVFFHYHLPHNAIQYFNNIKNRLDPCKSWLQSKADSQHMQILCEQDHGQSIQVIEASTSLKESTVAHKAFAMTEADLEAFEKTQIHKDTAKLSKLLQQDFTTELAHLTFEDINKTVAELVLRMQKFGFTLKENLYLLAAWEMFFGKEFETKDADFHLLEICQSTIPEEEKIKHLSKRMDQLSVSTPLS